MIEKCNKNCSNCFWRSFEQVKLPDYITCDLKKEYNDPKHYCTDYKEG